MRFIFDKFNSEIFGIRMANLFFDDGEIIKDSEDVIRIVEEGKIAGFDSLSVKNDTAETGVNIILLSNGFELVDTLITYAIPVLEHSSFPKGEGISVRKAEHEDIPQIMSIAREAFRIDQFHADPHLSSQKADRYYEQWAKNSCNGFADEVYVANDSFNERITGFITVNYSGRNATVGLAAIAPDYHGRGVFTFFLSELINILRKKEIETLYYGTQLANIAVLKTMAKFNGVPQGTKHIMHMMIK